MTTFDDRERAFEAKFAHDEEMQFRTEARAVRLTALWAAGLMGLSGEPAEAYVHQVLHSDVQRPGHAGALARLQTDLGDRVAAGGVAARLAAFQRQARAEAVDAAA